MTIPFAVIPVAALAYSVLAMPDPTPAPVQSPTSQYQYLDLALYSEPPAGRSLGLPAVSDGLPAAPRRPQDHAWLEEMRAETAVRLAWLRKRRVFAEHPPESREVLEFCIKFEEIYIRRLNRLDRQLKVLP